MGVERSYLVVMVLCRRAGRAGRVDADPRHQHRAHRRHRRRLGFDAITVALLGPRTPQGIVLAGLLFGALQAGSVQLLANTTTPQDLVEVLQSVIVLFIAAPGSDPAASSGCAPRARRGRAAGEGLERIAPQMSTSPASVTGDQAPDELVVTHAVLEPEVVDPPAADLRSVAVRCRVRHPLRLGHRGASPAQAAFALSSRRRFTIPTSGCPRRRPHWCSA